MTTVTAHLSPKTHEIIRAVAFYEKILQGKLLADLIEEALTARGITDVDEYIARKVVSVLEQKAPS